MIWHCPPRQNIFLASGGQIEQSFSESQGWSLIFQGGSLPPSAHLMLSRGFWQSLTQGPSSRAGVCPPSCSQPWRAHTPAVAGLTGRSAKALKLALSVGWTAPSGQAAAGRDLSLSSQQPPHWSERCRAAAIECAIRPDWDDHAPKGLPSFDRRPDEMDSPIDTGLTGRKHRAQIHKGDS